MSLIQVCHCGHRLPGSHVSRDSSEGQARELGPGLEVHMGPRTTEKPRKGSIGAQGGPGGGGNGQKEAQGLAPRQKVPLVRVGRALVRTRRSECGQDHGP